MKWKRLVSSKKRSNLERDNKETNKTMVGKELLEKNKQRKRAHWHQRRKRPLKNLNLQLPKIENFFWEKDTPKP